jgi:hypothetical protein
MMIMKKISTSHALNVVDRKVGMVFIIIAVLLLVRSLIAVLTGMSNRGGNIGYLLPYSLGLFL